MNWSANKTSKIFEDLESSGNISKPKNLLMDVFRKGKIKALFITVSY
jgi:hypothetical protein